MYQNSVYTEFMNNLIYGEDSVIFESRYFDPHTGALLAPIETPNYTVVQVAESYYLNAFDVGAHRQICDLEITLPLTPGIVCTTDGMPSKLSKNEVYLSFYGQIHSLSCGKSGRFQTLAWNVKSDICRELLATVQRSCAAANNTLSVDISRQVTQILAEFTAEPLPHFPLALDALITSVLVRLSRGGATPSAPDLSPKELAPKLLHYLDHNFLQIDRAESLSARFGYTYSHICKVFSAACGVPPGTYLQEKRMAHARTLLEGGSSVASVSQLLGYASAFNFSRAYKNHFGVPPSAHKGK